MVISAKRALEVTSTLPNDTTTPASTGRISHSTGNSLGGENAMVTGGVIGSPLVNKTLDNSANVVAVSVSFAAGVLPPVELLPL